MFDEAQLLAPIFAYPRLVLVRGEGSYVWDEGGKRYLDYTAGLGVVALGHGRRDLAEVLAQQFATLGHCSNLFGNLPSLAVAQRLKELSFASRIWFANSGTEANEAALKFARLFGRAASPERTGFVAFKHGFHGRTMGALATTHHAAYRKPFAPLAPGVRFAEFNDLASVEAVLDERVCAVIVEPVQGEGGVLPAAPEFLRGLRALCEARGALLIFDEVQCGLGRTGEVFAYQHYGVVPDMVTLAKPLANGLPLGAVLLAERVVPHLAPGHHGSTFAGGPAVCAVAERVLAAVSSPELLGAVRVRGAELAAGLSRLASESPLFSQARGLGLMQALIVKHSKAVSPAAIVAAAKERGLLVTRAGEDAVRLLPPLTTTSAEIAEALAVLSDVARALAPKKPTSRRPKPVTKEAAPRGAMGVTP